MPKTLFVGEWIFEEIFTGTFLLKIKYTSEFADGEEAERATQIFCFNILCYCKMISFFKCRTLSILFIR